MARSPRSFAISRVTDAVPAPAELAPLFADSTLGRYCADWSLPIEGARATETAALAALVARPAAITFAATSVAEPSRIVGILTAELSEWDTEFWGLSYVSLDGIQVTGELEADREELAAALLDEFDRWCVGEGIRFAYARVQLLDLAVIHALERHGYHFIETTLANSLDLRTSQYSLPSGYTIRAPRADETAALVDMTADAFVTHRFYADPGFPKARVDEMYERWVESSLASPDLTTIVLDRDGEAKGFFIYRDEDHRELLGVTMTKWRMGVLGRGDRSAGHGIPLFEGAMAHVAGTSDIVESSLSLRNLRSFNMHTKLGFRGLAFSSTYHKWW